MIHLAAAVLSFTAATLPADVRLAWKFREGDVIRYRILQEIHQSMSGMGNMETDTRVGQVLREKVQSVAPDGTAKIEVTWEALRYRLEAPMGGSLEFDSTKDSPESAAGPMKGLSKIVGSAFQVEMKPSGEIVSLRGIDELMQKVASDGGGMVGSMVSRSFNDASMKRALESVVLPEKALADGETWERESQFDVPSLGKLKVDYDFKLHGMEEVGGSKSAKVGVVYSMALGGGKPDLSSMPGAEQFDVDLTMDDAKGEGTVHFSPELGRMVRTELTADMDMNMNMKPKGEAKPGAPEGMKLEIRIQQRLTASLLGASDPSFEPEAKSEPKK